MSESNAIETRTSLSMRTVAVGMIVVGVVVPLALYGRLYGGASDVTPAEAKELLRSRADEFVLVDVRPGEEYAERHIDGAESWPLNEVRSCCSAADIPPKMAGRTILVVCEVGVSSVAAARHLQELPGVPVRNVRGGLQEWVASAAGVSPAMFDRWRTGDGRVVDFARRDMSRLEQWVAFLSGIGLIKPTYTLLSLVLAIVLWRSTAADLVALRWAMICFFVGENFCAVNWLVFNDTSWFSEYLHGVGMALCFGFSTYAILEGMDQRVFMLSAPGRRCAALSLCGKCIKNADVPCGFRRAFMILIPALMAAACMPLAADHVLTSYNSEILGVSYNYTHRLVYQLFEAVYCPAVAVVLLGVSLGVLLLRKSDPLPWAKVFFAAGAGAMGFSLLRTVLAGLYSENQMWFTFWEEITELLFIIGLMVFLWIFRQGLFRRPVPEAVAA